MNMKLADLISKAPLAISLAEIIESAKALVSGITTKPIEVDETFFGKPPANIFGDVVFSCFKLAKELNLSPAIIASKLEKEFRPTKVLAAARAEGPYLNLSLNRMAYTKLVLDQVHSEADSYGCSTGQEKQIMVEYSSPNTNKPQHLGHIRNNLIGWTVASLLQAIGFKVVKTSIVNDRGIHICKSMLAYQKWGQGASPESERKKPDHFVGNYYVLFEQKLAEEEQKYAVQRGIDPKQLSDPAKKELHEQFLAESQLMKEAMEMLRHWESNDQEIVALWTQMNNWVYEGFDQTYRALGVDFDKTYYESGIYTGGRDIIMKALSQGRLVKQPDGSILAPLSKHQEVWPKITTGRNNDRTIPLPDKVVLRSDGTSLYITQDLNLARIKFDDYNLDYSIYCIGSEQDLYMQQLFGIMRLIGFPGAGRLYHLSYGMVYLPEGKMKSREGKVVDADDLIEEMAKLAEDLLHERYPDLLSKEEIVRRSWAIGLSAIKVFILGVKKGSSINFDPRESISFEGRTGPYLQYTYARASSVVRKADQSVSNCCWDDDLELGDEEWTLIKLLADFPQSIYQAAINCEPALLVDMLFNIGQAFNQFYHSKPILKADGSLKDLRLSLTQATRQVLGNGLRLLGVTTLEEM